MRNCTVLPLPSASVLQFPLKSLGMLPVSSPSWIGLIFNPFCVLASIFSVCFPSTSRIQQAVYFGDSGELPQGELPQGKLFQLDTGASSFVAAVKSSSTHRKKASSPMVLRDLLHHPLKESTSSGTIKGKLMPEAVKAYSRFN